MNLFLLIQLFILGISSSISFCWTSCYPILFLALTLQEKNFSFFLSSIIKYSITKILSQTVFVLGLYLVLGKMFAKYTSNFSSFISIFFGSIFLLIGLSQIIKKQKNLSSKQPKKNLSNYIFNNLINQLINKLTKSVPVTIGLFSGLNLCLPKIFVLGYIFTKSYNFMEILCYNLVFTIGEILSPIIIILIFIKYFSTNWFKNEKSNKLKTFISYITYIIFLIFGITNIYFGIKTLFKLS